MSDSQGRFTLSIAGSQLEIVGSEQFIDKQIERFEPLIVGLLAGEEAQTPTPPDAVAPDTGGDSGEVKGDLPKLALASYENLFALADDKIQILKDLPGSGKAQKAVSAALLTAYGNTLRGAEDIAFDTIREMCEAHGCLDSGNFAKTLSNEKELFIVTGDRKKTLKLTVPGKRKAEQMARDLNAQ